MRERVLQDGEVGSAYLRWIKHAPPVRFDLRGSNLLPCTVDDLPGAREALSLDGPHEDGYPPLVEAIAARYGVSPEGVAVAAGASGANFLVYAALLRPGDEVVVEQPAYEPLLAVPKLLGARIRRFPRRFENGFRIDPEDVARAITAATRLVVLTNLHNPTGVLTPPDTLLAVGELAARVGAEVLVDEVYLESVPGGEARAAANLSPIFISTSSLTKAYGLSGLRAGWALARPEIAEKLRRVRDLVDVVGSFPAEVLAFLAFRNLENLRCRARSILEPNFAHVEAVLRGHPRIDWVPPAGGSVVFPLLRGSRDSTPFVEFLARHRETGVVPGGFFEAPAHFRIALGGPADILRSGLEQLGKALEEWRG